MQDMETRFMELAVSGFECSQIMMMLALDIDGNENPDLIRAMGGLTGGMGRTGGCCGALTGGAAVLGYYTARGEADELEHEKSREMIAAYVTWFEQTYKAQYGGVDCHDIIEGDFSKCLLVCAPLVQDCFEKVFEILTEYEVLG